MTATHWLEMATVEATIVLALAGLSAAALSRASATARHLAWASGLAGLLAVFLAAALPGWRILPHSDSVITPAAASVSPPPAARAADIPVSDAARDALAPAAAAPAQFFRPVVPPPRESPAASPAAAAVPALAKPTAEQLAPFHLPWNRLIIALWAIGACVASLPLAIGWLLFLRRARKWPAISSAAALEDAKSRVGIPKHIRLVESPDCHVPMTFGLCGPSIALPTDCRHWPPERWHMVLAHELAHIRRRDVAFIWMGLLARSLAWFHPLAWLAFRQLCIEAEKACDDAVLSSGIAPRQYAATLLEIAASVGRNPPPRFPALAMARRSAIEKRVRSVLKEQTRRTGAGRFGFPLAAAGILLSGTLAILRAADSAAPATHPAHNPGVFILGDLPDGTSGDYSITPSDFRVLDALREAKVDATFAQGKTIVLVRHTDPNRESRTAIPYADLVADPAKNLPLQDNDMLIVQRGSLTVTPADTTAIGGRFWVLDDTRAPGEYDMIPQKLTVMQALVIGRFDHDGLSTRRVDLYRNSHDGKVWDYPVHIAAILAGTEPDRYIQDGDVISVESLADQIKREGPEIASASTPATEPAAATVSTETPAAAKNASSFYVMGAVSHPGEFDLHGQQVLQALAAAGAGDDLKLLSVTLVRRDAAGNPGESEISIPGILADPSKNEPLEAGDLLVVHHDMHLANDELRDLEAELRANQDRLAEFRKAVPNADASDQQKDLDAERKLVEDFRAQIQQWSQEAAGAPIPPRKPTAAPSR